MIACSSRQQSLVGVQFEVIAVKANTTTGLSAMVWEKLRRDSWKVSWCFQVGWPLEH